MKAYFLLLTTFTSCCVAVICLESLIQEEPGIGNLVTVCSFLFISIDGFINELNLGRKALQVPVTEWLKLVVIYFIVNVINNASFNFNIAMPLYMIFRSGSLAASLITEKIVLNRKHSTFKHLAVFFITLGILFCTFASRKEAIKDSSITDWSIGICLLSTSLILSARIGIYQEQIYAKWGRHHREALFFTHFLPLPGFLLLANDIYKHSLIVLVSKPKLLYFLVGNVGSQYICARSIFWLGSHYSSLTITLILTLRKFFSIVLSVWLFGNIFTTWHWCGTFLILVGTLLFSNTFQENANKEKSG